MNKITIESDGSMIGTKVTVNGKEVQVVSLHFTATADPFSLVPVARVINKDGAMVYVDLLRDDCSGLMTIAQEMTAAEKEFWSNL